MLKVAMVNTVLGGSHGRIMRDLQKASADRGFTTTIAYGRGSGGEGDHVFKIDTKTEVLTHVALTRLFDRHARGSRFATRKFVQYLEILEPDLLHLHNVHGYYLHAETLFDFIRTNGIPTVWTQHDCWALTGHCSHFVRANCMRWKTGCYQCPLKHAYPASYGLDASKTNWQWKRKAFSIVPTLRIVAPSQWLAGVLEQSYLQDVSREVIPNGVDLSLFKLGGDVAAVREGLGVRPDQMLLTAVAAPFDARKGFDDALQIARILGDKARVLLVGLTDKQLQSLPEGVIGIKRTDGPEELVSIYRATDCLFNPTYEDTYPTVNMEAMACGTPVAGYGVGGATEQLVAPCGVAVPVGDVTALADAAMLQAERREDLQHVCREYAENHFDRTKAIDAYCDLYQRMTGA